MLIRGTWTADKDGKVRPFINVFLRGPSGVVIKSTMLVDSGADRTVLYRTTFEKLGLTADPAATSPLAGVVGSADATAVELTLILMTEAGTGVSVVGTYLALLDSDAPDGDLIGRDVLDVFHVILSRAKGDVLLLAGEHDYEVVPPS